MKIPAHQGTDPAPLGRVLALALPPLTPRPGDSIPVVSPVGASAPSVLQQLHHLTLVNGIDALRGDMLGDETMLLGPPDGNPPASVPVPACGTCWRTPPGSLQPPVCPGDGTTLPSSSGLCSRWGCEDENGD